MNACRANLVVAGLLSLAGCVTPQGQPDNTASGALIGGASGAIIGASVARHPGVGAAVGAASGAIVGGLIGHSLDQTQQARLQTAAPQTWQRVQQGQPLSVEDVKALARSGVSDELIISQIHNTGTVYHLGTADIIDLKNAGVSTKVIDFMINTPSSAATPMTETTVVSEPPPPLAETVIVAVWVGGAWTWYGGRWVWIGGHWAVPPHPHAVWIVGGWEFSRGHRVWRTGYWR